jgi:hypothetical protein
MIFKVRWVQENQDVMFLMVLPKDKCIVVFLYVSIFHFLIMAHQSPTFHNFLHLKLCFIGLSIEELLVE